MKKRIVTLILIITFGLVIKHQISTISNLLNQENEKEIAQNELKNEKLENKLLKHQLSYTNTDEFIENEARSQLNYSKQNEIIFIAPESQEKLINNEKRQPNWEKWKNLFF